MKEAIINTTVKSGKIYYQINSNTPVTLNQTSTSIRFTTSGTYKVRIWDDYNNSKEYTFSIDAAKPTTTLINGKTYTAAVKLDAKDATALTCYVNDVKTAQGTTLTKDGTYTIKFVDAVGNTLQLTLTIKLPVIDKTAPTVSGVTNNKVYKGAVTLKFTDASGIKSATLNKKSIKSGHKVTAAGVYELVVYDKNNNYKKVKFTIDLKAPIVKGVSSNKVYKSSVKVTFSDDGGVKTATLNGKSFKSGTKLTKAGKKTLVITDKAGRKTTKVFYIDKTAPKVTGVKNKGVYKSKLTIKVSDDTGVKLLKLNGKTFKSGTKVSKKGKYTLVAIDKASRKTTITFTIK